MNMSLRLGFILGLAVAGLYVLLAARRGGAPTMADLAREEFEEEQKRGIDPKARLRQAFKAIGEQIEQALAEAREAAQEAEEEMKARYRHTLRRGRQGRR